MSINKGPLRPVAICHAPKPVHPVLSSEAPDSSGSDSVQTRFQLIPEANANAAAGSQQASARVSGKTTMGATAAVVSNGVVTNTSSNGTNSSPSIGYEKAQEQTASRAVASLAAAASNPYLNQQQQVSLVAASSALYQQQQQALATQAMYTYWNMCSMYNAALSNQLLQMPNMNMGANLNAAAAAMGGSVSPHMSYPTNMAAGAGAQSCVLPKMGVSPTMLKVPCATTSPLVLTPTFKVDDGRSSGPTDSLNSMNSTSTTVTHKRQESKQSGKKRHGEKMAKRANGEKSYNRKIAKKGSESSHNKVCSNCGTSTTPFWRKNKHGGLPLCNACGLYFAKNDAQRPKELWGSKK